MAHHESTPSSSSTMSRLWRESRERDAERERERTISKLRQEASLKRVSAAVEKSGNEARAASSATAQSDRHRLLNQSREPIQPPSQQQPPPNRTAMTKLFHSRTDQSLLSGSRNPSNIFDTTNRRSEPALLKSETTAFTMDKQQEMDAIDLRFRRSLPTTNTNVRSTQELASALQSTLGHDTGSCTSSSGSSASSSGSSAVTNFVRSAGPPLTPVSELHASRGGDLGRPLERARSADVVNRGGGGGGSEPVDDMTRLRQQVSLLLRTLEEEKKRRAMEQKLMQQKILELQGLIRHNMPEQKRELERSLQSGSVRTASANAASATTRPLRATTNKQIQKAQEQSPYKTMKLLSELQPEHQDAGGHTDDENDLDADEDEEEEDEEDSEDGDNNNNNNRRSDSTNTTKLKMRHQLTRLRAQMRTLVHDAQQEAQALKKCLDDERRAYERKERQLRLEASLRVTSLEERYAYAKKKLLAKTSLLTTQVSILTQEKEKLEEELEQKNQRIQQLELAVGGRRIIESSQAS